MISRSEPSKVIRRVLEELEARLEPPLAGSCSGSKGKLEFKRYGAGRHRMKIRCKGLDLPEDSKLELLSGDAVIAILGVRKGRTEIDEEHAADAPALAAGDVVTLRHEGVALLSGRVNRD